jgi:hypothetical protein
MPLGDGSVDFIAVEGTVGGEGSDRSSNLVEQGDCVAWVGLEVWLG